MRMCIEAKNRSVKGSGGRSDPCIRYMILRDMPQVLAIEKECFDFPWTEKNFIRSLRQRNCIGIVAQIGREVVGFVVYEILKKRIHLLNLGVSPRFWRKHIATALIGKIKRRMSAQRRRRITVEVREVNLRAQLFFKSQEFKAIGIVRDFYENGETAYAMMFHYRNLGHAGNA